MLEDDFGSSGPGMSAGITPRWEWRCFAPSLSAIAKAAGMPVDAATRESDEIYILDLAGPVSDVVKIRAGVVEVKHLIETSPDGLELWVPALKARLPLDRQAVLTVFRAWLASADELSRASYTVEQLLEDVIASCPALRAVRVHKSRRSFTFTGCLAELVEIGAGPVRLQSFALEQEDPKRLLAALRELGLDAGGNASYAVGLKRVLGLSKQGCFD